MRQHKRTAGRLGLAMLVLAMVVRILTQTGLDSKAGQAVTKAARSPQLASFLFYLELGQVGRWPTAHAAAPEDELSAPPSDEGSAAPPQDEQPQQTQPSDQTGQPQQTQPAAKPTEPAAPSGQTAAQDAPLTFTKADADKISIGGKCTYTVDKLALLQQASALNFDQEGPTVLIVHTHTSEAYTQEAGWEYEENDTARTQDPNYSVIRVGNELTETLESRGVSVIHDTSFNDYPSYNGAYNRTLTKIEAWLEQYPSIQMVIDLHRDAAADAEGNPVSYSAEVGGESAAQLMLVMGTDEGGLSHPGWKDNLSWALKLQAVMNRMYPGLCRNLDLRTERFNQHATPGSMLIEVGASGNTLKQAIASARDLGEGLAALIAGT